MAKSPPVTDLQGLGPKSAEALGEIGIHDLDQLRALGAIRTWLKLKKECTSLKPSLNFLYALVGAIEGRDWREVARNERDRLMIELDSYAGGRPQDL